MKAIELKNKLIDEINLSDNKNLLEELYHYLHQENKIQTHYKLSPEQNNAIKEAQTQIKNGDFLTSKQADQDIEKWLNG